MNSGSAPQRIGLRHGADQAPDVRRDARSTDPVPALPRPEELEGATVPGDDGFRLHNDHRGSPVVPNAYTHKIRSAWVIRVAASPSSATGWKRRFGTTWLEQASATVSGGSGGVGSGCTARWDCSTSTTWRTGWAPGSAVSARLGLITLVAKRCRSA